MIINIKQNKNIKSESGFYKIDYQQCRKIYIVETCTNSNKRVYEDKWDYFTKGLTIVYVNERVLIKTK